MFWNKTTAWSGICQIFDIFFSAAVATVTHLCAHFFHIVLFVTSIPCTLSFCYNYILPYCEMEQNVTVNSTLIPFSPS